MTELQTLRAARETLLATHRPETVTRTRYATGKRPAGPGISNVQPRTPGPFDEMSDMLADALDVEFDRYLTTGMGSLAVFAPVKGGFIDEGNLTDLPPAPQKVTRQPRQQWTYTEQYTICTGCTDTLDAHVSGGDSDIETAYWPCEIAEAFGVTR